LRTENLKLKEEIKQLKDKSKEEKKGNSNVKKKNNDEIDELKALELAL
jgi:hypothetical protein